MRPLGGVGTLGIVQKKITNGYGLFSTHGLKKVSASKQNNNDTVFDNTRMFLRLNAQFKEEYGADIDVCSGNVLVLPDDSIKIIDYDPDLPSNYLEIPRYKISAEHRSYWIRKMSEVTR